MRVTIFGSGYVGLVTGACFAEVGNDVLCVDVDPRKVAMLQRGEIPIHEPGLDEVVRRNSAAGRLRFTTDIAAGVEWGQYELTVSAADGAAASSVRFYAGWYAPADTVSTPDTLELSLDRPDYRPGDTARLRIVPRAAGVALVEGAVDAAAFSALARHHGADVLALGMPGAQGWRPRWARELKALGRPVVFGFDGDEAGGRGVRTAREDLRVAGVAGWRYSCPAK